MAKTKLHKIELYQFKDFPMDEFVEKYLYEVNPHELIDEDTLSVYTSPKMKMTERREGARSKGIIVNKCKYLQDVIIRRANSKKDSKTFSLNADILRSVIGKEYKPMLEVLRAMDYIEIGDGKGGEDKLKYYQLGKYSTIYTLKDVEVSKTKPFINFAIQGYKEKTIQLIKDLEDQYIYPRIVTKHGETFLKRYLTSLNYIKIEDRKGLTEYIKKKVSENKDTEPYYGYVVNQLDNKKKGIYRVDDSGRMYHILTNLDREVKQFLTIDFTLDCKNSHPLLFNYFIYKRSGVKQELTFQISSILHNLQQYIPNFNYRNDGKNLRKLLIANGVEREEAARFYLEELYYIYLTSTGQLWDDICARYPDLTRDEVKEEMFKAVFYSNSPDADRWNKFAEDFKKRFPFVYLLISDWKRERWANERKEYMEELHLPTDRGSASLSIAMMALEANIFTTILSRLYAKRWNAIHIHDCIVIPKDGNANHPTVEEVKKVMAEVYQEFGLAPTFDLKVYQTP